MLIAVLLGVILVALSYLWSWRRRSKDCAKSKEIPGWNRPPDDPKMGDLVACSSIQDYLVQRHKGGSCPVISFWWKEQKVVSTCSPQAFKDTENMYNRSVINHIFGSSSSDPLHGANNIQAINGTEWEKRKKLLHKTVRGSNLESFFNDFVQISLETRALWVPGELIQLKEIFRMTLKGIISTSLGNVFEDEDGINQLANAYCTCKSMSERLIVDSSSDVQQDPVFSKNLKHVHDCMKKMLKTQTEERDGKPLPLLDALLGSGGSEDEILSDMKTFLGGFHTSGYFGMWTLLYLAKHPHVQKRLVQEVEEKVCGDTAEALRAYVLTSNTYLRQVLDESLRLSSTAGFSGHYSDEDLTVEGYHVPANTLVLHAMGIAMNNDKLWKNPNSFDPDRFAPGSSHAKRGREFRPFGVSCPRRCPANHFVYMMFSVYVTVLIQHFVFLSSSADEREVEKKHGLTTGPKGAQIRVELRKKTEE